MIIHALLITGAIAFIIFLLMNLVVFMAEFVFFFIRFLGIVLLIGAILQALYWIGISPVSPLAIIF